MHCPAPCIYHCMLPLASRCTCAVADQTRARTLSQQLVPSSPHKLGWLRQSIASVMIPTETVTAILQPCAERRPLDASLALELSRLVHGAAGILRTSPVPAAAATHYIVSIHKLGYASRSCAALLVATALFLACKAQEEYRQLRDVINASVGAVLGSPEAVVPLTGGAYATAKAAVVAHEQAVLRLLQFQVMPPLPHAPLLHVAGWMGVSPAYMQRCVYWLHQGYAAWLLNGASAEACAAAALWMGMTHLDGASPHYPSPETALGLTLEQAARAYDLPASAVQSLVTLVRPDAVEEDVLLRADSS